MFPSLALQMKFELFIASRYLRAKRRQAVIGVITAISIIGVAAGVTSLIVALSINNGFRQDLQDRLLGSTSHVNVLRAESDGIKDWQPLMDRLSKQPHVVAAAPAIYDQVLISRGPRARGAVLKGMIPASERKVSDLLNSVKIGSVDALEPQPVHDGKLWSSSGPIISAESKQVQSPDDLGGVQNRLAAMPPVILGKGMADDLGATLGSVVLVVSPQGELTPFGLVPKYTRFRVAGIFNSGFYDYDSSWAFASLRDAQQLEGLGDVVTVLEFKIDDIYAAGALGDALEKAAGQGFMSTNWMEQNKAIFRALRLERLVTFITIGLIVFVAALNILISLIMMVMEKTRDIAVLVSMGARREQVRRIFIWQGLLIGIVGTLLGLAAGETVAVLAGRYHWIALSSEVYAMDYVPFVPRALDAALVVVVSLAISFIATVYPSQSAARVLPAEALRYE